MDRHISFRYRTEADRYWHDKVEHPARCNLAGLVALAATALIWLI